MQHTDAAHRCQKYPHSILMQMISSRHTSQHTGAPIVRISLRISLGGEVTTVAQDILTILAIISSRHTGAPRRAGQGRDASGARPAEARGRAGVAPPPPFQSLLLLLHLIVYQLLSHLIVYQLDAAEARGRAGVASPHSQPPRTCGSVLRNYASAA